LENVSRVYGQGAIQVKALRRVTFEITRGEFTTVVGPSGSGKTTLLNVMSGLDRPTEGRVLLEGREIDRMSGNELSDFRRDRLGFIFQSYNLIPVLSVRENVEYVLLLRGMGKEQRREKVRAMLREVGLLGKEDRFPNELSGGQQQRVAVARAMVADPDLILADEPTANLDSAAGSSLLDLMRHLNEVHGKTFLFSTHDPMVVSRAKRVVTFHDGRLVKDVPQAPRLDRGA
jgi:putative ABC transport system ATP-binding protein